MADTPPSFSKEKYFPNVKIDKARELKIKVELGYIYIPPTENILSINSFLLTNNQIQPPPGGKQQETLINNQRLRKNKSDSLSQVVNGVMPKPLDIYGAPYSTFLAGTIQGGTPHPLFNLLQAPVEEDFKEGPNPFLEGTAVQQNFEQQVNDSNVNFQIENVNSVGKPQIPSTTKTSKSLQDLGLEPLTTYNIWAIEGSELESFNESFDFQPYIGYTPKEGSSLANLAPYAQTIPDPNTPFIKCFASNGRISLKRKYALIDDLTFDKKCNFVIYNTVDPQQTDQRLAAQPVGFNIEEKDKVPVGFCFKFKATLADVLPQETGDKTTLTDPKIIVSWGDLNFNGQNQPYTGYAGGQEFYDSTQYAISLYSLVIDTNGAQLFINCTRDQVVTNTAKDRIIGLSNFPDLRKVAQNKNTKSPAEFELYVYFSGPFMKIGTQNDPGSWSDIGPQKFNNSIFNHQLPKKSEIQITAQYMNLDFTFGPPLFSPYDPDNNKFNTKENSTTNTLNYVQDSTQIIAPVENNKINGDFDDVNQFQQKLQSNVKEYISKYVAPTGNYANKVPREGSDEVPYGSASIFTDARVDTSSNEFKDGILVNLNLTQIKTDLDPTGKLFRKYNVDTKVTFPKTLAGHVYNFNLSEESLNLPKISSSVTRYDLTVGLEKKSPSIFLSNSLKSVSVEKNIESNPGVLLKGDATFVFQNLNRSKEGNEILFFMRNNVSVLKLSAGYDEKNLEVFFEGVVEKLDVTEKIAETEITVLCKDLMHHLFDDKLTCITANNTVYFLGMEFFEVLKWIGNKTIFNKHFELDLGVDIFNKLISSKQRKDPTLRFSPVSFSFVQIKDPMVKKYSSTQTYFQVLKFITGLLQQSEEIDLPVLYWHSGNKKATSPQSGVFSVPGIINNPSTQENKFVNGVKLSSRNGKVLNDSEEKIEKDEDKIFLRKKDYLTDNQNNSVQDIQYLHGLINSDDGTIFKSSNDVDQLMGIGIYRGLSAIDQVPFQVYLENKDTYSILLSEEKNISKIKNYIGYPRTIDFGDETGGNSQALKKHLVANEEQANIFIKSIFDAFFLEVYESVSVKVFVTKPLKEYGHFRIFFENEDEPIVDEIYFYSKVSYIFDIQNNLIMANINGAKKPPPFVP
jgi:hypothetical protein